jgi:Malectin domain
MKASDIFGHRNPGWISRPYASGTHPGLARQTPYYSNDSHGWSPDNHFHNGQLAAYATAVTGTDDPELFESERWANFSYAIPVTPGRYVLTPYFAAAP